MAYFNSRDIAAIALSAALWGVLNSIFSPIVFSITHLPLFCDLIGFSVLTVAAWWIRKAGAIAAIGLIAKIINFTLNPQALTFLGFTAAAFVFDLTSALIGFNNFFKKTFNTTTIAIVISTLSAAIAGFIIGTFFMTVNRCDKFKEPITFLTLKEKAFRNYHQIFCQRIISGLPRVSATKSPPTGRVEGLG